jgi:segregation and condensation protein A
MNESLASTLPVSYSVHLDVFEGPLDLLLHLVKKHELDIFDIPISFVTSKYLEYLEMMSALNLDVAGEYLLMAATLAYIKSRELLPPDKVEDLGEEGDGDEEIDPRQELIRRLLEYQKYKDAAGHLGGRPVMGRNVWTRGGESEQVVADNVDPDALAPLAEFPVLKLVAALDRVLSQAKVKLSHDVSIERLSVSDRINELTDRIRIEGTFSFRSCFSFLMEEVTLAEAKHEAVVTFLAILEMAKLGIVELSQPEHTGDYEEEIYLGPGRIHPNDVAEFGIGADDDYQ